MHTFLQVTGCLDALLLFYCLFLQLLFKMPWAMTALEKYYSENRTEAKQRGGFSNTFLSSEGKKMHLSSGNI